MVTTRCEECEGCTLEEVQKPNRKIRLEQNETLEIFDNDDGTGHHTHLVGDNGTVIEGWQGGEDDRQASPTCKPWNGLRLIKFPDKHLMLCHPIKP